MYKLLFLLIVFVFVSCKKHETNVFSPINEELDTLPDFDILINDKILDFPLLTSSPKKIVVPQTSMSVLIKDYISSYRYIKLQTNKESLVGNISKICIDDSILFILDRKNNLALRFSDKGDFLGRIGQKGRGPGEFNGVYDMSLNYYKKEVCLLDLDGGKLIFYDYNGSFIKEQPLYYFYSRIEFLEKLQVIFSSYAHNSRIPYIDCYRLIMSKYNQIPLYRSFSYPQGLRERFHWEVDNPLQISNGRIFYNYLLSDTIWEVSDSGLLARYTIDIGKSSPFVDKNVLSKLTNDMYRGYVEKNKHFSGVYLQTKDVLCCYISDETKKVYPLLYNKSTGSILYGPFTSSIESHGLLSAFLSGYFNFVINDTSFVKILEPFQVLHLVSGFKKNKQELKLTNKENDLLKDLDEEDNPILMVVDLKSF